jgi:DnaJ-class molecular chaperone
MRKLTCTTCNGFGTVRRFGSCTDCKGKGHFIVDTPNKVITLKYHEALIMALKAQCLLRPATTTGA